MTDLDAQLFGSALDAPGRYLNDLRDPATGAFLAPKSLVGGIDRALAQGLTGAGTTIAVIDSGVWMEHPLIRRAVVGQENVTDEGPEDRNGHGTVVALIALSTAPDARVLSVKALNAEGRGRKQWLIDGIEKAAASAATVANLSAGVFDPNCNGDCELCAAAARSNEQGTIVVAAAGNRHGVTACPAKLAVVGEGLGFAIAAFDVTSGRVTEHSGIGNFAEPVGTFELRAVE